jgi:16S rRNA (adenine1518-N6/adenine1519-N6)-dimethyltransferase
LHNTSKIGQMASIINAGPEDVIIEIGPGAGALTKELIKTAGKVIAVEIDKEAIAKLREKLGEPANLEIINEDFLEFDLKALRVPSSEFRVPSFKIIGNIPYYITAPIIEKLIDNKNLISKAWLTVQKEVADRMAAAEGSKTYGSLSVFCQFHADVKKALKIDRKSFFPVPKVDSAFVEMDFNKKEPVLVKDEKTFTRLYRAGFNQRRKMLINNVKRVTGCGARELQEAFKAVGINEKARAEDVSILKFAELSNVLYNTIIKS